MQTTQLRMKIHMPSGAPAVGASVVARLSGVGVSLMDGYIDRSHVEAATDAQGIAELTLWPSIVGMTGVEYRITARGSDGAKLLDELVTVPESSIEVWLHDIVMLPPPTAKPYDEASILSIQQDRIAAAASAFDAVQARDASQAHAIEAASEIAAAQTLRIEAQDSAIAAANASSAAEASRLAAEQHNLAAGLSEQASAASALDAAGSAAEAQSALQATLALYGSAEALQAAVAAAQFDADAAATSSSAAVAASTAAGNSEASAQLAAGQAQTSAGVAQESANTASTAAAQAASDRLAVASDRDAVIAAAGQVSVARTATESAALSATQAATVSLDRSAGLIAHAENLRGEIDADRVAAETARTGAEALFGDLAAIDAAVQITYANRAIVDVALTNNLIVLASR